MMKWLRLPKVSLGKKRQLTDRRNSIDCSGSDALRGSHLDVVGG